MKTKEASSSRSPLVELKRLLDTRYLDLEGAGAGEAERELPILGQDGDAVPWV